MRISIKETNRRKLFIFAIVFCTMYISCTTSNAGDKIRTSLIPSIFDVWTFKSNFSGFETLKLNEESLKLGFEFDGEATQTAMQNVAMKAKSGQNVTMVVYGGSTTKGADLGCENRKCTFHYALHAWWNAVVAPLTDSYMKREVIAVGGTGSTYFGHCWREYLLKKEMIDIVLWEFYINDPDSQEYGRGLEKFIRTVLLYESHPALILVKFFSRAMFPIFGKCNPYDVNEAKTNIIKSLSKHYDVTTLDLLSPVCSFIKASIKPSLTDNDMFIEKHPSHIAHAQIAYILIDYIRRKLLSYLFQQKHLSIKRVHMEGLRALPHPLYGALDQLSVCWSAVMPDDRFIMPHNLHSLSLNHKTGFSFARTSVWEQEVAVRRDVRGGYIANYIGQTISISFDIKLSSRGTVYAAVSHLVNGGDTLFQIIDSNGSQKQTIINCSRTVRQAMDINILGRFPPGITNLVITTVSGGCQLSAIVVE